jgi:alginate O-acetyltransferase complex protein AlgJ
MTATTKNKDGGASGALIAIFLALLWLPTCDWLWNLDQTKTANEKRTLAEFPRYGSEKKLGAYLGNFDQFFDDHFGFRNQLVHWNTQWKHQLFDESPVERVLEGEKGWLYWTGAGAMGNPTGQGRFQERDLVGWQKCLEARRDWLAQRKEKYLFVVAPDKQSIYPEYFPRGRANRRNPDKLDQFLAYMRTHSTVEVVDLRPALIAAKKEGPTYLQTDTHWNNFGAFTACQQLVGALQKQLPGLKPLSLQAFDRKNMVTSGGDLAILLDQQNQMLETRPMLTPRLPLEPLRALQISQPGFIAVVTKNPQAQGKAVLFRDSFAEAWEPFLGYDFQEVIYVWKYNWNKELLEREKPEVVIDEIVERNFNTTGRLDAPATEDKAQEPNQIAVSQAPKMPDL